MEGAEHPGLPLELVLVPMRAASLQAAAGDLSWLRQTSKLLRRSEVGRCVAGGRGAARTPPGIGPSLSDFSESLELLICGLTSARVWRPSTRMSRESSSLVGHQQA